MKIPLVMSRERSSRLGADRECGTCHACCVLPRIHPQHGGCHDSSQGIGILSEGKPAYDPCRHLTDDPAARCGVYPDRPAACREFMCLWRTGVLDGDDRRRPDTLGLMFSAEEVGGRVAITAWELWPGAARDYPGRGVIEAVDRVADVAIYWYGVPASLLWKGPESVAVGTRLSLQAMEDPTRLADWLEDQVRSRRLEVAEASAVERTLAELRAGRKVIALFQRF